MKKLSALALLAILITGKTYSNPVPNYYNNYSPSSLEIVRSNLYIVGKDGTTTTLVDGDLTQYDATYSNAVDGMDARKLSNFSENIGMERSSTILVIERRHTIETADSIFYKIWNLKRLTYQLEFIMSNLNHPGLTGYLEDSYLHKNTSLNLNGTNHINFTPTADSASVSPYRFRIIFANNAAALPFTFTYTKINQQNTAVNIDWKTANENNILNYNIERSSDGTHFNSIALVPANHLSQNSYSWSDNNPLSGNNYYRIQSAGSDGEAKSSDVLEIFAGNFASIGIFPNPVISHRINLSMPGIPDGDYTIQLLDNFGRMVLTRAIHHSVKNGTETIEVPKILVKGLYELEISKGGIIKFSIKFVYK